MSEEGTVAHAAATVSELGIATIIVTLVDHNARRGKLYEINTMTKIYKHARAIMSIGDLKKVEGHLHAAGYETAPLAEFRERADGAINNNQKHPDFWVEATGYLIALKAPEFTKKKMRYAFLYFLARVHLLPWSALILGGIALFLLAAPGLHWTWVMALADFFTWPLWKIGAASPSSSFGVPAFYYGSTSFVLALYALHLMSVSSEAYRMFNEQLGEKEKK